MIVKNNYIKAYENLKAIAEFAGFDMEFTDALWQQVMKYSELYEELVYYMTNRTFLDTISIKGYTLCDLYVYQMDLDNIRRDTGKNTNRCNKEAMVLYAFRMMAALLENPEDAFVKLREGKGMDMV